MVQAAAAGKLEELDLPQKDLAMIRFVQLLTENSYRNSPEEIDRLRNAGWSDAQIAETVLVVGMFSMFNRVADGFGLEDPRYFEKEKNGPAIIPATQSS